MDGFTIEKLHRTNSGSFGRTVKKYEVEGGFAKPAAPTRQIISQN